MNSVKQIAIHCRVDSGENSFVNEYHCIIVSSISKLQRTMTNR